MIGSEQLFVECNRDGDDDDSGDEQGLFWSRNHSNAFADGSKGNYSRIPVQNGEHLLMN